MEIFNLLLEPFILLMLIALGVFLVKNMTKDGELTATEVSKIIIMAICVYMTIVNAKREPDTQPLFDTSTYLIVLGSLLTLAGIDILKINKIIKK